MEQDLLLLTDFSTQTFQAGAPTSARKGRGAAFLLWLERDKFPSGDRAVTRAASQSELRLGGDVVGRLCAASLRGGTLCPSHHHGVPKGC